MRILHLNSDWKWTGPAEPMLVLSKALRERGHDVAIACPCPPQEGLRGLAGEARAAGLGPALAIEGGRGAHWRRDTGDARRLRTWIAEHEVDVVHGWHTRDHLLALRAASRRRRLGATAVARSVPGAERIGRVPWNRWLFGPGSDATIFVSPETAARNALLRRGRPSAGCLGAVDPGTYGPGEGVAATRAALGLGEDEACLGVVARVQRHRRFDLLLEGLRELAVTHPAARLLICGRGTHLDEVAREPAARMGLSERVVFAGYREDDYASVLRAMDVLTFLVPGSDGTCRALLQAAACAVPAVVTRRGALPEIVVDGETGLVVDEDKGSLAAAWRRLLDDEELRARLGRGARRRAEDVFAPARLAREVEDVYSEALRRLAPRARA